MTIQLTKGFFLYLTEEPPEQVCPGCGGRMQHASKTGVSSTGIREGIFHCAACHSELKIRWRNEDAKYLKVDVAIDRKGLAALANLQRRSRKDRSTRPGNGEASRRR